MTIGVGYLCDDGIVLCADTQITYPQNHKYYESKLYMHFGDALQWTVAFTFAGNPILMKMFNGKFDAAMQLMSAPYTAARIQEVIETVLSLMDVLDNDPDGLHTLAAIVVPSSGDEMRLLRTDRKAVMNVPAHDIVGVGDSSLLRFFDPLLGRFFSSAKQARMAAIFLVLLAKRYVDGCGGDTQACIVRSDGVIDGKDIAYNEEQELLRLEHRAGAVLKGLWNGTINDEEFASRLETFCKTLKEHKTHSGGAAGKQ